VVNCPPRPKPAGPRVPAVAPRGDGGALLGRVGTGPAVAKASTPGDEQPASPPPGPTEQGRQPSARLSPARLPGAAALGAPSRLPGLGTKKVPPASRPGLPFLVVGKVPAPRGGYASLLMKRNHRPPPVFVTSLSRWTRGPVTKTPGPSQPPGPSTPGIPLGPLNPGQNPRGARTAAAARRIPR